MKQIIEADICAKCAHLEPSKPLPTGPLAIFSIDCECAKDWPYTKVSVIANAISTCPQFQTPSLRAREGSDG